MRIGQTSAITFTAEVAASLLGFIATVYVAQTLGPNGDEVLGVYYLITAIVIWTHVISGIGAPVAIKKRLSEAKNTEQYLGAGVAIQVSTLVLTSILLFIFQPYIQSYLRGVPISVIIALLLTSGLLKFINVVLDGHDLVHISSLLNPLNRLLRSIIQISLILLGLKLTALFAGYAMGAVCAGIVGVLYLRPRIKLPTADHIRDLVSYGKFAWLSSISGRGFSSMDTLVLGLFVSDGLIGVYEVSWNLASILALFGSSIARSMFPAISKLSSDTSQEEIGGLVTDSLRFAGLLLIPGLIGAIVIGEGVLLVYGSEFTRGQVVLVILIAARLIYTYQHQFVNALNAVDRPDLAFRVNGVFFGLNLILNLVLTWQYGWTGAAVATAISTASSLTVAYRSVNSVLPVSIPVRTLSKQGVAAVAMGGVVYGGTTLFPKTLKISIALVAVGSLTYGVILLAISPTLQQVINNNLRNVVQ